MLRDPKPSILADFSGNSCGVKCIVWTISGILNYKKNKYEHGARARVTKTLQDFAFCLIVAANVWSILGLDI